ncbi:MAG: hypothetical protein LBM01_02120 [Christensenellaceae bacterium]|nr:hypothetical protein [Christensenellaceae bacterium]
MALSERLKSLLITSVEEYIRHSVPISSGALAGKMINAKSPATIRNDLKTLEEMGYIKQVHTSGGRIPTSEGYREYITTIMNEMKIESGELKISAEQISGRISHLPKAIDEITKRLAEKFDYPVLVKTKFDKLVVNEVLVIPLVEGATMILIKTVAGSLNTTIQTERPFADKEALDMSSALTVECRGLTLKEMFKNLDEIAQNLEKKLIGFGKLCRSLAENIELYIEDNITKNVNMTKLLGIPEYKDFEKIKKLSETIDDDEKIKTVMASEENVIVCDDSGVIKFDYTVCGESIASVGIIGPERMDYKTLIGALFSLFEQTKEQRMIGEAKPPTKTKNKKKKGEL